MMLSLLLPLLCGGAELGRLRADLGSLQTTSLGSDAALAVAQEHVLELLRSSEALSGLPELELRSMELALTAMASKKATPGTETFVSHVLNITEKHMKVSILSQLESRRQELQASRENLQRCHDDLSSSLVPAREVRHSLSSLRDTLDSCTAGLNTVRDCGLTALVCERAMKRCGEWRLYDEPENFDAKPDPDSSKCDNLVGYEDVGDYYKEMHQYWARMAEEFIEKKEKCDWWVVWCRGNHSECSITPEPGPFPPCGDTPKAATICGQQLPQQPAGPGVLACQSEQDALDRAACKQASMRLAACKAYNSCYESANATLSSSWGDACSPLGLIATLRQQYYGVLRIECLVHAVTGSGTVDQCKARSIHNYDLSMFDLENCQAVWIREESSEDDCRVAQNPSSDQNTSGTEPYKQFYYASMQKPFACSAECCQVPIESFVPLR